MNKLFVNIAIIAIFLGVTTPVQAIELASEAGASARPAYTKKAIDERPNRLRAYLAASNSPMVDSAEHFVSEADRLNLDWKLVAAIAGVESTFGKHIPTNSYNGWGWGVFTGTQDGIHFSSWNDGITDVSEGLRYKYVDRGAVTVEQMGRIYAASPVWAQKVNFFLHAIENFSPKRASQLAVTI